MNTSPEHERLNESWFLKYKFLLKEIRDNIKRRSDRELAAFRPQWGDSYERHRMMVVGQATNGWDPKFTPKSLHAPIKLEQVIAELRRTQILLDPAAVHGPACWVQVSRFWQVVRRVVWKLEYAPSTGTGWVACFCWSNLAKVAPFEGGNPAGKLRQIQLCCSPELLELEIECLNPRSILVLAGEWWCDQFRERYPVPQYSSSGSKAVRNCGVLKNRKWIIAAHPRNYSPDSFADEIVEALSKLRPENGEAEC